MSQGLTLELSGYYSTIYISYQRYLFDGRSIDGRSINEVRFDRYKDTFLMIIDCVSSHYSFKIETIILKM